MALYAELLAAAMAREDGQPGGRGELLAAVIERRNRLAVPGGPVDRLAAELGYDVALIRLCTALGAEASPAEFDRPADARGRLERHLADSGLPLGGGTGPSVGDPFSR
jgi:hypothetical protein